MIDYLNIGLDFGTHQSKVCIEDTTDPRNRVYTFFKFRRPDGKKTYFLPSVVQVNKDFTLSYGFVDETEALILGQEHTFEKPRLEKPAMPKLNKISKKPPRLVIPSEEQYLASLSKKNRYKTYILTTKDSNGKKVNKSVTKDVGQERYRKYVAGLEARNKVALFTWEQENAQKERINAILMEKYDADCRKAEKEYQDKLAYWEKSLVDVKAVYRYFKIATFSQDADWSGDIPPKYLSTWFLTYVMFCIFEEYPDEVSFQMGIPESIGENYSETQKKDAEDVFYMAYQLYKHFGRKEDYLKASITDLKSVTNFKSYHIDYDSGSQVLVLPEAFAGLLTITQQGKIGIGMTLLVDIGGGSTDISLFNVVSTRSGEMPNISRIISIHRGLNYIYSLYKERHFEMGMEEIRRRFAKNPSAFKEEIEFYRRELAKIVQNEIYHPLVKAALKQGISVERLMPILEERPVVFSGGGGVYDVFHKGVHMFSEPVSVSKDLLSLRNVSDKRISDEELSILSVAYGLSIPQVREPVMTPLKQLFAHIHLRSSVRTSQTGSYEHGLTDVE